MIDPPSRNSAWRYGFPNPPFYTDNELNCGGYNVQWKTNGGKCGVCRDPYHEKNQPHVYPGKYANGIITKTYRDGQEIEVVIEITSNHMGTFFFKIGELDTEPITEEKLVYLMKQPNEKKKYGVSKAQFVIHRNRFCCFFPILMTEINRKDRLVLPRLLSHDYKALWREKQFKFTLESP